MYRISRMLVAIVSLMSLSVVVRSVVISDHSFENISCPTNGFVSRPTSPDWTFPSTAAGDAGVAWGPSTFGSSAAHGNKFSYIQSTGKLVRQLTGLTVGQDYVLRFKNTWRVGPHGNTVQLNLGSNSIVLLVVDGLWRSFSTPKFTATSTSMTLSIDGLATPDYTSIFDEFILEEYVPRTEKLVNGDFEFINYPDGTWRYGPNYLTGNGWFYSNQVGFNIGAGQGTNGCPMGNTSVSGNEYAFIQRNGLLSQDLTNLTVGHTYKIRFWISSRSGQSHAVSVSAGPQQLIPSVSNASGWIQVESPLFVASSSTMPLVFQGIDGGFDATSLIDDVSLVEAGGIPESLFVMDDSASRKIIRYHLPSKAVINTFGSNTFGMDMVQDANGDLLICDRLGSHVKRFNSHTGQYLGVAFGGVLSDYFGIARKLDGSVLVTGSFGSGVARFNPATGSFLGWFVPEGTAGLALTRGITLGNDGDLYVCSLNKVFRFNGSSGMYVNQIVFPILCDRVAMGPDGRVYVTGEGTTVHVGDPSAGTYVGVFVNASQGLTNARGIEFGPDGMLYVANANTGAIFRFHPTTGLIESVFLSGSPMVAATSMKFAYGSRNVSGRLRLRNRDATAPPVPSVEMEFRAVGSQIPIFTRVVPLNSTLDFTIEAPYPPGLYDISVKHSHWLRRTMTVNTLSGNVTGLQIFCTNGDCDLDNEVGPGDFGMLSAAFGAAIGDSNYNPDADLDGDGEVGPADFGILSASFGTTGDL